MNEIRTERIGTVHDFLLQYHTSFLHSFIVMIDRKNIYQSIISFRKREDHLDLRRIPKTDIQKIILIHSGFNISLKNISTGMSTIYSIQWDWRTISAEMNYLPSVQFWINYIMLHIVVIGIKSRSKITPTDQLKFDILDIYNFHLILINC